MELRAGTDLKNHFKEKFEYGAEIVILYNNFTCMIGDNT